MPEVQVIDADMLQQSGSWLFEGIDHGGVGLSFFLIDSLPGAGPDLHAHPYMEVFVVHEGEATFVVGDQSLVAVGVRLWWRRLIGHTSSTTQARRACA